MSVTVPAGSYVQLELALIREGKFLKEVNEEIAAQAAKMAKRIEDGDTSVSSCITVKIKLKPDEKVEGVINLEPSVDGRISPVKSADHVRLANGKLLCQPEGSHSGDVDQIHLFYDRLGHIKGMVNTETGEVEEPEEVAGKVGTNG